MTHTRNHKLVTITIPPEEHEAAIKKLPMGEIRTFSALVRIAIKDYRQKKK